MKMVLIGLIVSLLKVGIRDLFFCKQTRQKQQPGRSRCPRLFFLYLYVTVFCVMNTTVPTTETVEVVAYRIRHPKKVDPFKLTNTLQDLMSFPSSECILKTDRVDNAISGKCAFVLLTCEGSNEEQAYVIYLQKNEGLTKCIGNDPLTAWDSSAALTKI